MSTDPTTTQDTLTDRLASTAAIAILEMECETVDDSPGSWIRPTVAAILGHLAVELCALEQLHGRPLTLQHAAAFLCAEVEP